ncbi:MAG: asparagine synthase-related protein, partial [Candidatus Bathyarchaeia archaeon]
LDLPIVDNVAAIGHNGLRVNVDHAPFQPLSDCNHESFIVHDGTIYNSTELREGLSFHRFETSSDSETIIHLVEESSSSNLHEAVMMALPKLYGVYAFAVIRGDRVVLTRDPVGVKPLYWGENDTEFAFASERKALWSIGVKDVTPLPPGFIGVITPDEKVAFPAWTLNRPQIVDVGIAEGAVDLKERLHYTCERFVKGFDSVAVAFSGGVDSSLIAKVVDDLGVKPVLFAAGFRRSHDVEVAERVASKLGYEIRLRNLSFGEAGEYVSRVVYAVEEADLMKVGVGLPLYASAESARSLGFKVILSGQGADELFGGYARYLHVLRDGGYEELHDELWGDILKISEVNLQRDDAVTMANSVESIVPFLDLSMIETAMSLHPRLKVSGASDPLRKLVLRRVAEAVGLPMEVVNLPKKAVQYGSGADRVIRRLSKKRGFKQPRSYLRSVLGSVFEDVLYT